MVISRSDILKRAIPGGEQAYRGVLRGFARAALIATTGLLAVSFLTTPAFARKINFKINKEGFTSSKICGECHIDIYNSWRQSMHSRSVSDPIFRAAYIMAFFKTNGKSPKLCLGCHSPTTRVTNNYKLDDPITSEGVTCDFCHSLKEVKFTHPVNTAVMDVGHVKYGPNKEGSVKIHDIKYSPLHSSAKLCATCHEYRPNGVPVMTTYSEWKEGPYAEKGLQCQYCHMPQTKGQIATGVTGGPEKKVFSHNLTGGHSISRLKKAVEVKIAKVVRKKDRMTIHAHITNSGSGHRVPTGIPTRKLILFCEVRSVGGKVYKEKIVYEKVIFDKNDVELVHDEDIMLGRGVTIVKDNRIFPKETRKETFTFYLSDKKDAQVIVWADYLYEPLVPQAIEMRIEMDRDEKVSLH
ncbi:MAG TPA: hypothetical protein ENI77_02890 [Nitrospirae bacterium]|nr:hypothetical protein [Nitrospirota bacterium]